jgi:hypothetical protein
MNSSEVLAEKLDPIGRAMLRPGEELLGVLACSGTELVGGRVAALAITNQRLLVQPTDRAWHPSGKPVAIEPDEVASYKVSGLGDDWKGEEVSVHHHSHLGLDLTTTDQVQLKMVALSGAGHLTGPLGGGEHQRTAALALLAWLVRLD